MSRLFSAAFLACVVCTSVSCNNSGLYKVVGDVTFDGQAIEDGDIALYPEDPTIGPDAGKIINGHYEIMAKPGKKKVDIRAARPSPTKKGMFGEPLRENYIPVRYNTSTELTAEIQASNSNRYDFALTEKAAK